MFRYLSTQEYIYLAILYIIKLVNTFAHINSNKEYDIKTTKQRFHIFLQNFKDENTVLNASLLNRYLEQLEKSGEGNIIINMDYDEITQLSKKLNKFVLYKNKHKTYNTYKLNNFHIVYFSLMFSYCV